MASLFDLMGKGPAAADEAAPGTAGQSAGPMGPPDNDRPVEPLVGFEPLPAVRPVATTSVAQALRRRRRSRGATLWIPLFFGAVLVGIGVWLYWPWSPKLKGELQAVPDEAPPRKVLTASMVPLDGDLDRKTVESLLKHIEQNPLPILRGGDDLMAIEVTGVAGGLEIAVSDTSAMRFVRVDLGGDRNLGQFYKEHSHRLNLPRERELHAALKEFFLQYRTVVEDDGRVSDELLNRLRNRIALKVLVGGLGYNLVAITGERAYQCVYESDDGRAVFFLLPRRTKRFTLSGRQLADGTTLFPGRYTVAVATSEENE